MSEECCCKCHQPLVIAETAAQPMSKSKSKPTKNKVSKKTGQASEKQIQARARFAAASKKASSLKKENPDWPKAQIKAEAWK